MTKAKPNRLNRNLNVQEDLKSNMLLDRAPSENIFTIQYEFFFDKDRPAAAGLRFKTETEEKKDRRNIYLEERHFFFEII